MENISLYPVTGLKCSYGKIFPACLPRSRLEKPRSREPNQPAFSYEHIEKFAKDSEVRRDLGNRASVILVFYKRSDWFAILDYSALVKSNQWF